MMPDSCPPRCVQRKYPTKATKREFLEAITRVRGVDAVALAQYFRMSYSGARVKLRRLKLQSFVEPIPDAHGRTQAWQLTAAGWRHLRYLQETQTYGGSKEKLIASLRAEVVRLKAETDRWKKTAEGASGILQENQRLANENKMLRGQRDEAWALVGRLRTRFAARQGTPAAGTTGKR